MTSSRARAGAEVAGIAAFGLLHVAASGALLLVALRLAAPGVLQVGSAGEALSAAVALGLACLRVPLESGDVSGTFAPLGGLVLTLWGMASAFRRRSDAWPEGRTRHVAALAVAFSLACLGAALAAGAGPAAQPSVGAAATAGLVWGTVAALWGTAARSPAADELASPSGAARPPGPQERRRALRTLVSPAGPQERRRAWDTLVPPSGAERPPHPRLAPGLVVVGVAGASALVALAALLVGAVVPAVAGTEPSAAFGGLLLAVAAAPNALAALVALGLGASVDVVLTGTALAGPSGETFSLWRWGGRGVAPLNLLVLTLVPLIAVAAGGRVAAATAPRDPAIRRGLTNGLVLGLAVAVVGWLGSFHASAGAAGARAAFRLGIPALEVVALGLVWGVAGAYLGPRLRWPRSRRPGH